MNTKTVEIKEEDRPHDVVNMMNYVKGAMSAELFEEYTHVFQSACDTIEEAEGLAYMLKRDSVVMIKGEKKKGFFLTLISNERAVKEAFIEMQDKDTAVAVYPQVADGKHYLLPEEAEAFPALRTSTQWKLYFLEAIKKHAGHPLMDQVAKWVMMEEEMGVRALSEIYTIAINWLEKPVEAKAAAAA